MKQFVKVIIFAVLSMSLQVPSVNAGIIYSESFDNGSADGFTLGGLWHVTQNSPSSGNYALGYVQNETGGSVLNGDYDTGARNTGTAFTPAIAIPYGPVTLTFSAINANEYGGSPDLYDRLRVWVSADGNSPDTILASTSPFDGAAVLIPYWTESNQGYNKVTIQLDQFAGQSIHIGFNFDTLDEQDNIHPGARIDDIQVTTGFVAAVPVPEPSSFALLGFGFGGFGGFVAMNRFRRRKT